MDGGIGVGRGLAFIVIVGWVGFCWGFGFGRRGGASSWFGGIGGRFVVVGAAVVGFAVGAWGVRFVEGFGFC